MASVLMSQLKFVHTQTTVKDCMWIIFIKKTRLFKYNENLNTKTKKKMQIKKSDNFHISAQNIGCGYSLELPRRGGSNEYSQSIFLSRNKKTSVYPCKHVLLKKCQNYVGMFSWWFVNSSQTIALFSQQIIIPMTSTDTCVKRLSWKYA